MSTHQPNLSPSGNSGDAFAPMQQNQGTSNLPNFGGGSGTGGSKITQSLHFDAHNPRLNKHQQPVNAIGQSLQLNSNNSNNNPITRSSLSPLHISLQPVSEQAQRQSSALAQLNALVSSVTPSKTAQSIQLSQSQQPQITHSLAQSVKHSTSSPKTPLRKTVTMNNNSNVFTSGAAVPTTGKQILGHTPTTAASKHTPITQLRDVSPYSREQIQSYNKALDSVALLGNEFEQTIRAFQNSHEQLQSEREKNAQLTEAYENQLQQERIAKDAALSAAEEAQNEVDRVSSLLEGANQQIEFNSAKLKTLERKCADFTVLEQRVQQIKGSLVDSESVIKAQEAQIANLNAQLKAKDRLIAELQGYRQNYEEASEKLDQSQQEIAVLQSAVSRQEQLAQEQLEQSQVLENQNQQINTELEAANALIGQFIHQCNLVHDEFDVRRDPFSAGSSVRAGQVEHVSTVPQVGGGGRLLVVSQIEENPSSSREQNFVQESQNIKVSGSITRSAQNDQPLSKSSAQQQQSQQQQQQQQYQSQAPSMFQQLQSHYTQTKESQVQQPSIQSAPLRMSASERVQPTISQHPLIRMTQTTRFETYPSETVVAATAAAVGVQSVNNNVNVIVEQPSEQQIRSSVNVSGMFQVLNLGNNRTVAFGENNLVDKVRELKDQLQLQENVVESVEKSLREHMEQSQSIEIENNQLHNENNQSKQQIKLIKQELQDAADFHKKSVDALRKEFDATVVPLLEEKHKLVSVNQELSQQFEEVNQSLQEIKDEKERSIKELIAEQEQIQEFSAVLLKEKEALRQENLSFKEDSQRRSRSESVLSQVNEDQTNAIACLNKDIETWKGKYKNIKREVNGLKSQFDAYRTQVLTDIQNQILDKSSGFAGVLTAIKKKYYEQGDSVIQSARDAIISEDIRQGAGGSNPSNLLLASLQLQSLQQKQHQPSSSLLQQSQHGADLNLPLYNSVRAQEFVENPIGSSNANNNNDRLNHMKGSSTSQVSASPFRTPLGEMEASKRGRPSSFQQSQVQQPSALEEYAGDAKQQVGEEDEDQSPEMSIDTLLILKQQYEQSLDRVNFSLSPEKHQRR